MRRLHFWLMSHYHWYCRWYVRRLLWNATPPEVAALFMLFTMAANAETGDHSFEHLYQQSPELHRLLWNEMTTAELSSASQQIITAAAVFGAEGGC